MCVVGLSNAGGIPHHIFVILHLQLNNNGFNELPSEIGKLTRLVELSVVDSMLW